MSEKIIKLNCGYEIRVSEHNGFIFLSRDDIESAIVDTLKEKSPKSVDRQHRTIAILLNGNKIRELVAMYDNFGCPYRMNGYKERTGWVHIFLAVRILHDKIKGFDLAKTPELFELLMQELPKIEIDEEMLVLWGATIKYHRNPSKYGSTLRSLNNLFGISKEDRLNAVRLMRVIGSQESIEVFLKKDTQNESTTSSLARH